MRKFRLILLSSLDIVWFQERNSLQGLLLRRQLAVKHREMLNVLVVEQQQKQVQYLELLKQHEATEEAAKASTQQKEAEKEPKESLPQQQQEIVDLTVSKNKEENHRTHETTTTTEEKVQSETWIEEKIPSSDFQYPISYFIHSYSNMYSSMASLKTTSIFDTH